MPNVARLLAFPIALGLALATSCAKQDDTPPTNTADSQPASAVSREQTIDVGGRRLQATVRGSGAPTIVLISALGATQDYWSSIADTLATQATVVAYDRAGVGKSELGTLPAHAEQSARDVRALLDSLGVPKPYLLVGHSFGGNVARLFASLYPGDIGGMVLEETQHEDNLDEMRKLLTGADLATFTRDLAPGFDAPPTPTTEGDYRSATRDQIRRAAPLPHVPFVVLTVKGRGGDMRAMFSAEATERIVRLDSVLMTRLAASVPGGRAIFVEGSGHNMHVDKPAAVLAEVFGMVAGIKGR